MQQQHLMQMQPIMAAYCPSNVTTDHIQQYLDENKSLILKIVENQNSGKLNECAENQARLQRNLMYLAAIADSQPQPPSMNSQYSPSGIYQAGTSQYMQAQQMTQQSLMAARSSMVYSQQAYPALQQQQGIQSQLAMNSSYLQGEAHNGGGSSSTLGMGFPDYGRSMGLQSGGGRGSKHDVGGSSLSAGSSGDGGETLYLKSERDHGN